MDKKSDFEIYLKKYCKKHGISAEEAQAHHLVKDYAKYCEHKKKEEEARHGSGTD